MARFVACPCLVLLVLCAEVDAGSTQNHVAPHPRKLRATISVAAFRDELHTAIADSLQAGQARRLETVRKALAPSWGSLPQTAKGRVSRRSVRYVLHRYLLTTHGVSVIGLEPFTSNGSDTDAVLLLEEAPAYVRNLMARKATKDEFSIEDAAAMAVMMESFVEHSGHTLLTDVALFHGWDLARPIDKQTLLQVLEQFFFEMLLGDDQNSIQMLRNKEVVFDQFIDDAESLSQLVRGKVQHFEFSQRYRNSRQSTAASWNPMNPWYSFEDAQAIASSLVTSFASFWKSECARTTNSLIKLDYAQNGRVWLTDFYAASKAGEWHFSESEAYLQEVGALDSSSQSGPRLILANYMQGVSNCLAHNDHFRVCCQSECDNYMIEIEMAARSPSVSVEVVLGIVQNLTTSLWDHSKKIDAALTSQLRSIAELHNGVIPIHSRLFSQWLHFVFPRECPYPHKTGSVKSVSATSFGSGSVASAEEIFRYADRAGELEEQLASNIGESDWRSQWSDEEELLSSQLHMDAPWSLRGTKSHAGLLSLLSVVGASIGLCFVAEAKAKPTLLPTSLAKSSYV